MTPEEITEYILTSFHGLRCIETWGETSFFYNPNNAGPRGTYFFTIKEKNGANDMASALDREGVFRVNFGITKATFTQHFLTIPKRPTKGGIIQGAYDFHALDTLTPHPIYGWMCWVALCSPSQNTFHALEPLLCEGYQLVQKKHARKTK